MPSHKHLTGNSRVTPRVVTHYSWFGRVRRTEVVLVLQVEERSLEYDAFDPSFDSYWMAYWRDAKLEDMQYPIHTASDTTEPVRAH